MSLNIAIAVLRYFPYGGLERNMLAIAQELHTRGHQVHIYTLDWQGDRPSGIKVTLIKATGLTNHARALSFANQFKQLSHEADLRVGFNRLPHLDVCYMADACFKEKVLNGRNYLYRFSPRSRAFLKQESAVAAADSKTQLMFISPHQLNDYQHHYQFTPERYILLPPGIKRDRCMPNDYPARRASLRASYGVPDNEKILLALGSAFHRKGLDRNIRALAKLNDPRIKLWIVGEGDPAKFIALATKLRVDKQIHFWGAKDNVEEFLWMSDLLLHPARSEAAGACLVEAIVAGVPVIATRECGFSHYISRFAMGQEISQSEADNDLASHIYRLLEIEREHWLETAQAAINDESLFSRSIIASNYIESCAG